MYTVAIASITLIGFAFGVVLAIAGRKLAVVQDATVETIYEVLPHANCGACGFINCENFAKAVVADHSNSNKCTVGGKRTAEQIGNILGISVGEVSKKTARLFCSGGVKCKDKFEYSGIKTCRNASLVDDGYKACIYGCLQFGDCLSVCKYDAIKIGPNKIPIIDKNKCTGCGMCVRACPRSLLKLVDTKNEVHVACSSHYSAKEVIDRCSAGCISCHICEKNCPEKAIAVTDNLATIDFIKCKNKKICVEKCPKKVIASI